MRTLPSLFAGLLLVSVAVGCSASHALEDYEAHVAALQRITCEHYFACCEDGPARLAPQLGEAPRDVDHCEQLFAARPFEDSTPEDLRAGRVAFDPAAAARCEASYRATTCDAWRVQRLLAPLGEGCGEVLVAGASEGEPCRVQATCGRDAYCTAGGPGVGPSGVCAPRLEPGAACVPHESVCALGEVCIRDPDGSATCQLPRSVGEPCSDGLSCESFSCSGLGRCEAVAPRCE